jgi:hypothetical protein
MTRSAMANPTVKNKLQAGINGKNKSKMAKSNFSLIPTIPK